MNDIISYLESLGCIWVRTSRFSKIEGNNILHWIGYCADKNGKAIIKAVVVEGQHSRKKLRTLINLAEQYNPAYCAIAGEQWIWYKGDSFVQMEEPSFLSEALTFEQEASINMVFLSLFEQLGNHGLTPQEIKRILDMSLLTNAFIYSSHYRKTWKDIRSEEDFLQAYQSSQLAYNIFELNAQHLITNELVEIIGRHLYPLPSTSVTLSRSYMKLTSERVNEDMRLEAIPGYIQDDLFQEITHNYQSSGHALDQTCGYGSFLTRLLQFGNFESIVGTENNLLLFQQLQVYQTISGKHSYFIHYQLDHDQFMPEYYSLILRQVPALDRNTYDNYQTIFTQNSNLLKKNGYFLLICKESDTPGLQSVLSQSDFPFYMVKNWELSTFNRKWQAILFKKV